VDLEKRVCDVKQTMNLQLDSVFKTLKEKAIEVEDTLVTNIAKFKEK